MNMDTRPQATHARLDRFNPTKHHHVRDQRLPHVAARLSQPRQRNRRPDRRVNKRAIRRLARLARRYENRRTIPLLKDVEIALWRAREVADRRLGGYWPWGPVPLLSSNIEHWTSQNLGWSFPCAEAVALIRRLIQWPCGRVIDIGAGRGLWTKVAEACFRLRQGRRAGSGAHERRRAPSHLQRLVRRDRRPRGRRPLVCILAALPRPAGLRSGTSDTRPHRRR